MKLLKYLLHGLLFSGGSAIIVYLVKGDTSKYIPPLDIIPPLIFSLIIYFIFILIGYLLTHRLEIAGLIASSFILGFFYPWYIFIRVTIIVLVSLFSIKVIFKKVGYGEIHVIFNLLSIAIVGFYLIHFTYLLAGLPWNEYRSTIEPINIIRKSQPSKTTTPDIYYIILDGYGRADMLRVIHNFDNSTFLDALTQRGFIIATRSQVNYPRTFLSLSSSLNMQYLETMSSVMGNSDLWWPVINTVHHSQVRKILESLGYRTVFFSSDWDYSDIRDGDFYETPYQINLSNFDGQFLESTNFKILKGIDRFGVDYPSYDSHRRFIQYKLDTLPLVATLPSPKFVFAHIIAPHTPYVFDRKGDPIDPNYPFTLFDPYQVSGYFLESRNGYVDQLIYINNSILKTIDNILANSITPPIIIIQADHGPGIFIDYTSSENTCLYERFSILNIYYLPEADAGSVPMDITPVNSFRFIMNMYFQTDLEILPDHQYFSVDDHIYIFTDVTGETQVISSNCVP